ncbi:MAG TPA: YHS domain-containing (seleno)protein [Xanthobacteraceae bacterium]|jgi:hypothetical protein|nr:YHS domain-containing (seleno)protein [Xanthobacteraceae bacterium]
MQRISRRSVLRLALVTAVLPVARPAAGVAEGIPLAIGGYDPVAYFTDGTPVPGRPDIDYVWDEYRYRFSSAEHRELFKADPVRYAPQFANFCAMALTRGEIEEGNPQYWLISEGRLYLFRKPVGPELFRRDLAGNIAKANSNSSLVVRH